MKKILFMIAIIMINIICNAQQTKILIRENEKIVNNDSTYFLSYDFYIPVPAIFSTLPDKISTLNSFMPLYPGLDHLEDGNVVFKLKHEFYYLDSDTTIKAFLTNQYSNYQYGLNNIIITVPDWIKGEYWDGSQWKCQD